LVGTEGETVTDTLASILARDPEWEALPDGTPWRIQELLRRCLTKDAHDRLRDIATVRIEITLALYEPATVLPIGVGGAAQAPLWRSVIPWIITAVVIVLAGVGFWTMTRPTPEPLSKFVITPPTTAPVRSLRGGGNELAISPDGRRIVYLATPPGVLQLYVRSLDEFSATPIAGTEPAGPNPFFSPDGESLAFFTNDGQLKKVSLIGGTPITLCEAPNGGRSGSWAEDTIVFSSAGSLYRVSAAGGEPETLLALDTEKGEIGYRDPKILPGGQSLLFTILSSTGSQIALLSLETGEQKVLLAGRQARYAPTGHLVYSLSEIGTLMAAPFDLATLEVTGDSVPLLEEVRQATAGQVDYSFSSNGTLVYVPGTADTSTTRTLVWVDREGQEEPLAAEPQSYQSPRISPDGLRLAITVDDSGGSDVWIYDLEREILTRLTFDPAADHYPVWTPDGRRIVFDSGRVGASHNLFWKAADGTGQAERLTTSPSNHTARSFSPDGKRLVFGEGTPVKMQVLSMEGERTSQPLFQSQFYENHGMISPDGQWIAYESPESGRLEVYVRPFPNVEEGKWQISRDGGTEPVWATQGPELFYRNGEAMMVVGIKTEPTFTAGSPVVLFTGRYTMGGAVTNYDISPDGQEFVMIKEADEDEGQPAQINVVLNWFEELKRLVPTN